MSIFGSGVSLDRHGHPSTVPSVSDVGHPRDAACLGVGNLYPTKGGNKASAFRAEMGACSHWCLLGMPERASFSKSPSFFLFERQRGEGVIDSACWFTPICNSRFQARLKLEARDSMGGGAGIQPLKSSLPPARVHVSRKLEPSLSQEPEPGALLS